MDNILKPISEFLYYNKFIDKKCILAVNGCHAFFINECLLREDKNIQIKFSKLNFISSKAAEKIELHISDIKKYFGEISLVFTDSLGNVSHIIELKNHKILSYSMTDNDYEIVVRYSLLEILCLAF